MESIAQPVEPADPALRAYVQGRSALAEKLLERLKSVLPNPLDLRRFLPDLLWSDSWADDAGAPHAFFPAIGMHRRYVIGPSLEDEPGVERCGSYCRFKTTTNWALDLNAYRDVDDYFEQLSKSMKKKLKRYVNGAERWGLTLERIQNSAQMDRFLNVFAKQWPGSDWETVYKPCLYEAYAMFEETGCGKCYLMIDEQGVDAVAALGYYTGNAYNLHLLARQDSALDFLSPGYCATYALIKEVMEEKRADYFYFGPGFFEYKERFMAKPMPIYRYERRCLSNLPGLVKLYNRARKQHTRRGIRVKLSWSTCWL